MPLTDDEEYVDVIRLVRGVRGRVRMRIELIVRFGYGKVVPWVRRQDFGIRAIAGPDALELRTPVELHGEDFTTVAEFSVGEGATVPFTLDYHRSYRPGAPQRDCQRSLEQTERFWSEWSGRCRYENHPAPHWRDAVVRSLITLKCLSIAADRRHHRGADHLAARAAWRHPQLGLPLLLDQGRDADPLRAAQLGLPRGGRWPGASGWCAPPRAARPSSRPSTASPASGA